MLHLPFFIVLSFPKCGTTSLDVNLRTHPEVCLPQNTKEIYFRNSRTVWTRSWFEGHFVLKPETRTFGLVSTEIVFLPEARTWLAETYPQAKVIVLLRDPIERATSHYFHALRRRLINGSLADVLRSEKPLERGSDITLAIRQLGDLYQPSIEWVLESYDRKNIHFVLFEELVSDPSAISKIESFLGVSTTGNQLASENRRRLPKLTALATTGLAVRKSADFLTKVLRPICPRMIRDILGRRRHHLIRKLTSIEEENMSPEKVKSLFELEPGTHKLLAEHYKKTLDNLNNLVRKDISQFWPWYR